MNWLETQFCVLIAECSHDLVAVSKSNGVFAYVSPSISRYGYAPSDVIGRDVYAYIHDSDLAVVAQAISLLEHTGSQTVRYRMKQGNSHHRWVESTLRQADPSWGEGRHVVIVTRDIEDQRAEEEKIRTLARELEIANQKLAELVMTDPLTGIGNRRMLMTRIETLIQEAERGRRLSVLMIDIDNFKTFNDTYGHAAGDDVIHVVAQTLNGAIRRIDSVARFGGEEFVVASLTDEDGAMVLGEKLRKAVESIETQYRGVTVSIGVAGYAYGDSIADLLGKADAALYAAKNSGRNRVVRAGTE